MRIPGFTVSFPEGMPLVAFCLRAPPPSGRHPYGIWRAGDVAAAKACKLV